MARATAFVSLHAFAFVGSLALAAPATTEPPPMFDARTAAMGSTGVSQSRGGAAVFHNPALLREVEHFTLTANVAADRLQLRAPLGAPSSTDSEPTLIPLFLVGGGYRISDELVLGLAAYTLGGFGAEYATPAGTLKTTLGAFELSPTLTFSVSKQLALGAGYRITHLIQTLEQPLGPASPAGGGVVHNDLSGTSFFGLRAGVYYHPLPPLKLGLAYHSKVAVDLKGTSEVAGTRADVSSGFSFPHAVKLGASLELLPNQLTLAVELGYLLHAEANKRVVTRSGGMDTTLLLDWQDSLSAGVGAEYFLTNLVPIRAGYRLLSSATPEDRPQPFFLPPGLLHSFHAGTGLRLPALDLDLGGIYSFGKNTVTSPAPDSGAAPGQYGANVLIVSLSATLHH